MPLRHSNQIELAGTVSCYDMVNALQGWVKLQHCGTRSCKARRVMRVFVACLVEMVLNITVVCVLLLR